MSVDTSKVATSNRTDAATASKPGPAARALPQLPLMVDDEGYLVAQSDFREPVGPSYWERDSQASTSE